MNVLKEHVSKHPQIIGMNRRKTNLTTGVILFYRNTKMLFLYALIALINFEHYEKICLQL